MISLGAVGWGSSPTIPITFEYEKQRSGADMQYRVRVTISPITGASFFGYPIYFGWAVDGTYVSGTTLKEAYPDRWSSAITYTTPWHTVANKTTGTTAVSINIYSGYGSSRNNNYAYSMEVDPAASEISVSGGTLGTPLSISIARYNSAFADNITYTCGDVTGNVVLGTTSDSVTWDTTNGNTVALSAQNPSEGPVNVTFTIYTYSGSTYVGRNSTTITCAIPEDVKPSVSLDISDPTGINAKFGAYVQGYSKLRIIATPTLAYGSPIKSYVITADGRTYGESAVTTDVIRSRDTFTVTAKVTDNRNHPSDPASRDITVFAYAKPTVNVTAYRCNSSGAADAEGAYMRIGFNSTISDLGGKNSANYVITYSRGSAITGSGTSFTSEPIACDVASVCTVEVSVSDELSSTTRAAVIPIAFTLTDFYRTGEGVSFGKVATRNGFDCAMDAYFGNKRVQEVGSPVADTDAVNKAYAVATFYAATEDTTYSGCYYRMVGSAKEWINPPLMLGEEYRTTERWYGGVVYTKLVDLGDLPGRAGQKSVNHGASAKMLLRVHGVDSSGKTIGYTHSHDLPLIWISANRTQIIVATADNEYADHSAMTGQAQIWYVKN